MTSTALGTIMPVLRDAGEMRTPFGIAIIAVFLGSWGVSTLVYRWKGYDDLVVASRSEALASPDVLDTAA